MLPLARASKQSYLKLLCTKMRESDKPLVDEPRTNNSSNFLRKKQRNTAVFWEIVACTKPELQIAILKQ